MAIAPCFIPTTDDVTSWLDFPTYAATSAAANVGDVESLFGPDWSYQLEEVCKYLGEEDDGCKAL